MEDAVVVYQKASKANKNIENMLIEKFKDTINSEVDKAAHHGKLSYRLDIPSSVWGVPAFDRDYIVYQLSLMYRAKGYSVMYGNYFVSISWDVPEKRPQQDRDASTGDQSMKTVYLSTSNRRG